MHCADLLAWRGTPLPFRMSSITNSGLMTVAQYPLRSTGMQRIQVPLHIVISRHSWGTLPRPTNLRHNLQRS